MKISAKSLIFKLQEKTKTISNLDIKKLHIFDCSDQQLKDILDLLNSTKLSDNGTQISLLVVTFRLISATNPTGYANISVYQ